MVVIVQYTAFLLQVASSIWCFSLCQQKTHLLQRKWVILCPSNFQPSTHIFYPHVYMATTCKDVVIPLDRGYKIQPVELSDPMRSRRFGIGAWLLSYQETMGAESGFLMHAQLDSHHIDKFSWIVICAMRKLSHFFLALRYARRGGLLCFQA